MGDSINLAGLFLKNVALVGSTMGTDDEFDELLQVIDKKRIVCHLSTHYCDHDLIERLYCWRLRW
jgi:D-arabinose 1-dehydrogenase-like Zn-dependent alcohol dehydrogenase